MSLRSDDAQGFNENRDAALKGGHAAGTARKSYEKTRNVKVVSADNFLILDSRDAANLSVSEKSQSDEEKA